MHHNLSTHKHTSLEKLIIWFTYISLTIHLLLHCSRRDGERGGGGGEARDRQMNKQDKRNRRMMMMMKEYHIRKEMNRESSLWLSSAFSPYSNPFNRYSPDKLATTWTFLSCFSSSRRQDWRRTSTIRALLDLWRLIWSASAELVSMTMQNASVTPSGGTRNILLNSDWIIPSHCCIWYLETNIDEREMPAPAHTRTNHLRHHCEAIGRVNRSVQIHIWLFVFLLRLVRFFAERKEAVALTNISSLLDEADVLFTRG